MTLKEIKEFLRDYNMEPTADMIDAIEEIYRDGFKDGQDVGYKEGYQAGFAYGNEVGRREAV